MQVFRADLHIHSVLSPCGSLEMGPKNIVKTAVDKQLDIIGITDHNSTLNCEVIRNIGKDNGLEVYMGVEVATSEEIHCLAFFETIKHVKEFQRKLDEYLPFIPNDVNHFGYQLQVNEKEEIIHEVDSLLISGLLINISKVEHLVHSLEGIFVPAHVNRSSYSLISQLGFVPNDLNFDALEISKHISKTEFLAQHSYLNNPVIMQHSDAHFTKDIGAVSTGLQMESTDFSEFRMALKNVEGRKVIV